MDEMDTNPDITTTGNNATSNSTITPSMASLEPQFQVQTVSGSKRTRGQVETPAAGRSTRLRGAKSSEDRRGEERRGEEGRGEGERGGGERGGEGLRHQRTVPTLKEKEGEEVDDEADGADDRDDEDARHSASHAKTHTARDGHKRLDSRVSLASDDHSAAKSHSPGSQTSPARSAPNMKGKFSSHRRSTCHRCANVRKRNVVCSMCPRIVCEICAVKWVTEHGLDAFEGGCPICKNLCCCADSQATLSCSRLFHCNRRSGSFAGALNEPDPSMLKVTPQKAAMVVTRLISGPSRCGGSNAVQIAYGVQAQRKKNTGRWANTREWLPELGAAVVKDHRGTPTYHSGTNEHPASTVHSDIHVRIPPLREPFETHLMGGRSHPHPAMLPSPFDPFTAFTQIRYGHHQWPDAATWQASVLAAAQRTIGGMTPDGSGSEPALTPRTHLTPYGNAMGQLTAPFTMMPHTAPWLLKQADNAAASPRPLPQSTLQTAAGRSLLAPPDHSVSGSTDSPRPRSVTVAGRFLSPIIEYNHQVDTSRSKVSDVMDTCFSPRIFDSIAAHVPGVAPNSGNMNELPTPAASKVTEMSVPPERMDSHYGILISSRAQVAQATGKKENPRHYVAVADLHKPPMSVDVANEQLSCLPQLTPVLPSPPPSERASNNMALMLDPRFLPLDSPQPRGYQIPAAFQYPLFSLSIDTDSAAAGRPPYYMPPQGLGGNSSLAMSPSELNRNTDFTGGMPDIFSDRNLSTAMPTPSHWLSSAQTTPGLPGHGRPTQ